MENIRIVGGPEIEKKKVIDEEDFLEVVWELNESPSEKWDKKFESLIKKRLELEDPLFGPYKPKIIYTQLILTIYSRENIEKQKEFYEEEFIEKVNCGLN